MEASFAPDTSVPRTDTLLSEREASLNTSLPVITKPTPTGAAASGCRAPSAYLVSGTMLTHSLTRGHVASPLNGTYCLKLVPQVHFLPSGS